MLARNIAPTIFSLFQTFFSFFQQIKKIGVENPPSIFFICLYFIGAGGDENLKKYLAWPNYYSLIFLTSTLSVFFLADTNSPMAQLLTVASYKINHISYCQAILLFEIGLY